MASTTVPSMAVTSTSLDPMLAATVDDVRADHAESNRRPASATTSSPDVSSAPVRSSTTDTSSFAPSPRNVNAWRSPARWSIFNKASAYLGTASAVSSRKATSSRLRRADASQEPDAPIRPSPIAMAPPTPPPNIA